VTAARSRPGQALVGVVQRELTDHRWASARRRLDLATQPPAVILMAGLQGAGKTTTAGKLAKLPARAAQEEGADGLVRRLPPGRHRAAADASAEQAGVEFFPSTPDQKPVDIAARRARLRARRHYCRRAASSTPRAASPSTRR
jgi:signal recognition particle subunit SRP54